MAAPTVSRRLQLRKCGKHSTNKGRNREHREVVSSSSTIELKRTTLQHESEGKHRKHAARLPQLILLIARYAANKGDSLETIQVLPYPPLPHGSRQRASRARQLRGQCELKETERRLAPWTLAPSPPRESWLTQLPQDEGRTSRGFDSSVTDLFRIPESRPSGCSLAIPV